MKHRLTLFASVLVFAFGLFAPATARAACMGAPDGKCDPNTEDCGCDDCLAACSGECTASNPPACTLEDACTCKECWTDLLCTPADKNNCEDDGTCDFFREGCCCADCAALANCAGFDGNCGEGGGGTGGAGGSGGTTGGSGGATGGSDGGGGGTGVIPKNSGGCGCTVAGTSTDLTPALLAAAALTSVLARRRRQPRARSAS